MKIAIPVWHDRVSPVFDVAGRLLLIDIEGEAELGRSEAAMEEQEPAARTRAMVELGVELLICGAVSIPLETMLARSGIRVLPQICGDVEEVLAAYRSGTLDRSRFAMPGCCGKRRRRCQGQRFRRRGRGRTDGNHGDER